MARDFRAMGFITSDGFTRCSRKPFSGFWFFLQVKHAGIAADVARFPAAIVTALGHGKIVKLKRNARSDRDRNEDPDLLGTALLGQLNRR